MLVEGYTDVIALHQAGVPEVGRRDGHGADRARRSTHDRASSRRKALFCQDPDTRRAGVGGQRASRRCAAHNLRAARPAPSSSGSSGCRRARTRPTSSSAPAPTRMRALLDRSGARSSASRSSARCELPARPRTRCSPLPPGRSPPLPPSVLRDELVRLVSDRLGLGEDLVNEALRAPARPRAPNVHAREPPGRRDQIEAGRRRPSRRRRPANRELAGVGGRACRRPRRGRARGEREPRPRRRARGHGPAPTRDRRSRGATARQSGMGFRGTTRARWMLRRPSGMGSPARTRSLPGRLRPRRNEHRRRSPNPRRGASGCRRPSSGHATRSAGGAGSGAGSRRRFRSPLSPSILGRSCPAREDRARVPRALRRAARAGRGAARRGRHRGLLLRAGHAPGRGVPARAPAPASGGPAAGRRAARSAGRRARRARRRLEATQAKLELEALQLELHRLERHISQARISGTGAGVRDSPPSASASSTRSATALT